MKAREPRVLRSTILILVLVNSAFVSRPVPTLAQEAQGSLAHRVKHQVHPSYPELARQMHIQGKVRLEVTVGPNGKVKNTKVVGGHPLLVNASEDALRKWEFEPAAADATAVIEFSFSPDQR